MNSIKLRSKWVFYIFISFLLGVVTYTLFLFYTIDTQVSTAFLYQKDTQEYLTYSDIQSITECFPNLSAIQNIPHEEKFSPKAYTNFFIYEFLHPKAFDIGTGIISRMIRHFEKRTGTKRYLKDFIYLYVFQKYKYEELIEYYVNNIYDVNRLSLAGTVL